MGRSLDLYPCELMGFNIGSFKDDSLEALQGPQENNLQDHLLFRFDDDVDQCVVIEEVNPGEATVKEANPIGTHMFEVMKNNNVPDIGLIYHAVSSKKQQVDGASREVLMRYDINIKPGRSTTYVPKDLTEAEIAAQHVITSLQ